MLKAHLKPDGFTVEQVARQIHLENFTWQATQNRRIRQARSHRKRLYWIVQHQTRRLDRAARIEREIVAKTVDNSFRLTHSEIAERAREHGATFHASYAIADLVVAELSKNPLYWWHQHVARRLARANRLQGDTQ